ncbi:hypothetical protein OPV22_019674 [Ensete ventricosum]|uniref:BHLH domain-containing protein n=1 Tax=Ensete ventricosum TaxID=4639 RepID=A0AAV8QCM0_ENSVE|nr:hypothetical protein OPV22_019674 [Ensete ventricosum]
MATEAEGLASELNWSSFDPSFSVAETEDVMAQLFGSQQMFWSDSDYDGCCCCYSAVTSPPMMNYSVGGERTAAWFPLGAYDQHYRQIPMNDELVDAVVKPLLPPPPPAAAGGGGGGASQGTKRRLHGGGDIQMEVTQKKWKKAQKSDEEDSSSADIINSRSSYCHGSEADEPKGGAVSMSSSSKGSAAPNPNPQSLYAKKRRERITVRLRILQNLVPNGTKVDISTMLEEAVRYVKFLQLQIKLLSSDEMWMYAPVAYNAMSLGFDLSVVSAEESDFGI